VTFDAKVVERDAKAKEKHDRMVVEAKEALERFYAEYNEKKVALDLVSLCMCSYLVIYRRNQLLGIKS
jgi:hypothetical protein